MRAVLVLLVCATASLGLVRAYSVEPTQADFSGWTDTIRPYNYVAQTICCNFDSLRYVELFAGEYGQGGTYTVTVLDGIVQLMSSSGDRVPNHGWVKFEDWDTLRRFTKGY